MTLGLFDLVDGKRAGVSFLCQAYGTHGIVLKWLASPKYKSIQSFECKRFKSSISSFAFANRSLFLLFGSVLKCMMAVSNK